MSIMTTLKEMEVLMQSRHGADISINLACHTAWGNDSIVWLVYGKNASQAAQDLVKANIRNGLKPVMKEEKTSGFMDSPPKVYFSVTVK